MFYELCIVYSITNYMYVGIIYMLVTIPKPLNNIDFVFGIVLENLLHQPT